MGGSLSMAWFRSTSDTEAEARANYDHHQAALIEAAKQQASSIQ